MRTVVNRKLFDCQEMFRHACTFCECADMAESKHHHDTADIGWYTSPAVIKSAFACEVFMKAILNFRDIKPPRSHKLRDLYEVLPEKEREWIKLAVTRGASFMWTDCFGFDYLDEISDAFVEWRYSYEIVGKKRAVMQINTGFLNDFRNALREACCQLFFKLTWEEYKER